MKNILMKKIPNVAGSLNVSSLKSLKNSKSAIAQKNVDPSDVERTDKTTDFEIFYANVSMTKIHTFPLNFLAKKIKSFVLCRLNRIIPNFQLTPTTVLSGVSYFKLLQQPI